MGVLLMYLGLGLSFLGGVSLLKPLRFLGLKDRRRAATAVGAGGLLVVAAAAWPAPLRRAPAMRSLLDAFLPAWQFEERHEIRVHAPATRVYDAIRQVTAGEIRLFQTLTWIRAPRLPGSKRRESILNPSSTRPILEVATSSGFFVLGEEPGREIVLGTLVVSPDRCALTPQEFAALDRPGYAKAAINFRVEDDGEGGSRVTTETRVQATDDSARRRFGAYWRVIFPGSALIRRMWLQAIRDRAEAAARTGALTRGGETDHVRDR
jgi:hypothetical protein